MPKITVDAQTYDVLRAAAIADGVPMGEIVRRAVAALRGERPPPEPDPSREVAVYAEYRGRRFEGVFVPATSRLVVTTGELAGRSFASPSAAAGAVVAVVNPGRTTRVDGWRLWHVTATGDFLDALRPLRPPWGST